MATCLSALYKSAGHPLHDCLSSSYNNTAAHYMVFSVCLVQDVEETLMSCPAFSCAPPLQNNPLQTHVVFECVRKLKVMEVMFRRFVLERVFSTLLSLRLRCQDGKTCACF